MALDYDNRTDFRAFDVLISAIDNATPADLRKAIKSCAERGHNAACKASERAIYRDMATLLRKHLKR